jgi:hypothetical protein
MKSYRLPKQHDEEAENMERIQEKEGRNKTKF